MSSTDVVQLRLSSAAIATLFPEGSTARVELQNAVAQEFIKKHIRPNSMKDEVLAFIKASKEEAIRTVLAEIGVSTVSWNQKLTLSDTLKRGIYDVTKEQLKESLAVEIEATVKSAADTLLAGIKRDLTVKVNALAEAEIHKQVIAKVTTALNASR